MHAHLAIAETALLNYALSGLRPHFRTKCRQRVRPPAGAGAAGSGGSPGGTNDSGTCGAGSRREYGRRDAVAGHGGLSRRHTPSTMAPQAPRVQDIGASATGGGGAAAGVAGEASWKCAAVGAVGGSETGSRAMSAPTQAVVKLHSDKPRGLVMRSNSNREVNTFDNAGLR